MSVLAAIFATCILMMVWGIVGSYHLELAATRPLHKWHRPLVIAALTWIAFWGLLGLIARLVSPEFSDAVEPFSQSAVAIPLVLLICWMAAAGFCDLFKYAARIRSLPFRFLAQIGATWGVIACVYFASTRIIANIAVIA